jgi:hypothetical protein
MSSGDITPVFSALAADPAGRLVVADRLELVLVIVIAVSRMAMAVMDEVHVVAMSHSVVPAAGTMGMRVARVREVRQRMLVIVVVMRRVSVAVVDVVDVALAFGPRVAAPWPVLVEMRAVNGMVSGHRSSLLCWTASATIWATCWSASE